MVQMRSLPRSGSLSLPDACFRHHQLPQFKYIAENLSPLAHGSNVVDATISDAMGAGQISLLEIDNSMDGSFCPVLVPSQRSRAVPKHHTAHCETNQRRAAMPYGALGPAS
jgi:hypothetical protein